MQDLAEEVPELSVEHGVDDGVEGAVDVTQPGDGAGDLSGNSTGLAESLGDVDHEERSPAEEESTCGRAVNVKKGLI